MDPVTHTFTGALLAETGLKRFTPLAAATVVVAANIPDVDIVTYVAGEYAGLAHRRGWTHGLPAMAVWPFVVAGLVLGWDRLVRRRRSPGAAPVRGGPVLGLAFLGVLTHPFLDWLNTYGMRWLMPLDGTWFYGDAVFIVDPWLWLVLGGPLFLAHSRGWRALVAWGVFGALASFLVLSFPVVSAAGRAVWSVAVLGLLVARLRGIGGGRLLPRVSGILAAGYVIIMVALSAVGANEVESLARERGLDVREVMVAPQPADPLSWTFLVSTADAYHRGEVRWGPDARLAFDPAPLPRVEGRAPAGPLIQAAARSPRARDYLVWARYPFYRVEEEEGGFVVRIGDARYADVPGAGGLAGLTVRLDSGLRVLDGPESF